LHELRTPLNAILSWAHVLDTDDLRSDVVRQRQALRAIARNAATQVRLVNDLLDVSRIISGKMRLQIAPTRLSAVVTPRHIAGCVHASSTIRRPGQKSRCHTRRRPSITMITRDCNGDDWAVEA
jgi:K+-sensing histidine kinase KdpD